MKTQNANKNITTIIIIIKKELLQTD